MINYLIKVLTEIYANCVGFIKETLKRILIIFTKKILFIIIPLI